MKSWVSGPNYVTLNYAFFHLRRSITRKYVLITNTKESLVFLRLSCFFQKLWEIPQISVLEEFPVFLSISPIFRSDSDLYRSFRGISQYFRSISSFYGSVSGFQKKFQILILIGFLFFFESVFSFFRSVYSFFLIRFRFS